MANKTNVEKNGKEYYRITRKVGLKLNKQGLWVDDRRDFYGKSKKEAEEKYIECKNQLQAGLTGKTQYFGKLADQFIKTIFIPSSKYSEGTKELYISAWRKYVEPSDISGQPIDKIKSIDIQNFYNTVNCSHSRLKSIHNLMKIFYKYASMEGYCTDITSNLSLPDKQIKRAKNDSLTASNDILIWEDSELKKITEVSKGHALRFLILLANNTGLRISELLGLKYDDIENNILHVRRQLNYVAVYDANGKITAHEFKLTPPKYNSVRDIPLNDYILKEFQEHKLQHNTQMLKNGYRTEYIFTTKTGNFIDRHNIDRSLKRLYNKNGIANKSIHTYRHTFATKLCASGTPIQTTSALLGHSSINITAKYYVNISHDQKLEAVKSLVLDI